MRRTLVLTACAALMGLTAACASMPEVAPAGPASYAAVPTTPSTKAKLYADCIASAAAAGTYGHASDPDTQLVLFTCTGASAQRFYDGLAARSAAVGSERMEGGRTYRSTNAVLRNLFGVDYCSTDGAGYQCVITLNAGEFLAD